MVRFIKAYNEGPDTVFELGVTAAGPSAAKLKGTVALLGRRPGQATAVENIDVMKMGDGILADYRVMVTLSGGESLRDKLRITEAAHALEELL